MAKKTFLQLVTIAVVIVVMIYSKLHSSAWEQISLISVIIACYGTRDEDTKLNLFLAGLTTLVAWTSILSSPEVQSAICLVAFYISCSIAKKEKVTIPTYFLPSFVLILLILESLNPGLVYYFQINTLMAFVILIGSYIVFSSSKTNFAPVLMVVLFCLGASFNLIQLLLITILILKTLQNQEEQVLRVSLLLAAWTAPTHPWIIFAIAVFLAPPLIRRWLEGRSQLIYFSAICMPLISSVTLEVKLLSLVMIILMSIKLLPQKYLGLKC